VLEKAPGFGIYFLIPYKNASRPKRQTRRRNVKSVGDSANESKPAEQERQKKEDRSQSSVEADRFRECVPYEHHGKS
jgi:ribosomal protein L9